MYTYKDFITGKTRRTSGKFLKWTKPTGILETPYAVFQRSKSVLLIPKFLLTEETLARLC
jgi:hypothetical protein